MPRRVTIKDIARQVGVHHTTVSRALRDDPNVSSETIQAVRSAAELLGYEPDPMMSALAAYRRANQPVRFKETLAFLWPEQTREEVADSPYHRRFFDGAKLRAQELGYAVDEFFLPEIPADRFVKILSARGIRGLLISAYSRLSAARLRFPVDKFSVVSMTASIKNPPLHRVGHDHFKGMYLALHHLKRMGFTRIGFFSSEIQDRVLERRYSGSFLLHHPLGMRSAIELICLKEPATDESLLEFATVAKPDCILMTYTPEFSEFRVGAKQRIPVFSLDVLPGRLRVPGIYQQMEQIAANAVDMVVEQLIHGRRGVPPFPKTVLSSGEWLSAQE